ncbi:MAG TPA: CDP-diacylglycerol diphosphatase [Roseiarcus sp.]|nr:CDP-diacylglycerol diphosphatase [Roseiarcus sp.]
MIRKFRYFPAVLAVIALFALIGVIGHSFAGHTLAGPLKRSALWKVVRVCTTNFHLAGRPFPCLAAHLNEGYVILRPPMGRPDTILSPTRPISGVEDPRLLRPGAPNYFAAAWRERAQASGLVGPLFDDADVALAVNAMRGRSQDHLHIHIGCLAPQFRRALDRVAARLPPRVWSERDGIVATQPLWLYRTGVDDAEAVNPFLALAEDPAMTPDSRALTTLALVRAPIDGRYEFVVIASRPSPTSTKIISAENLAHADCKATLAAN